MTSCDSCPGVEAKHRVLDAKDVELWRRRITTCPGHDDEGGRDWCAYCGKMATAPEAKEGT